jgi:hypothetical protein
VPDGEFTGLAAIRCITKRPHYFGCEVWMSDVVQREKCRRACVACSACRHESNYTAYHLDPRRGGAWRLGAYIPRRLISRADATQKDTPAVTP